MFPITEPDPERVECVMITYLAHIFSAASRIELSDIIENERCISELFG